MHNSESTINRNQTKRDRFVRIAEARTNKIIDMIRLLGNCSSKVNYEYNEEDIRKIFGVIEKELKNARNKFSEIEEKDEKFTLR
jgi:hypothetical protein